ncbi:hypothetical protein NPIL_615621 [Nephila pilipes]|uniref:Uncharacterized protein n=1 Tax=Nephila pilipes TaxID=299642 RepID=A0A8X6TH60_NEPPI|nr:hypothetical protein NPIL_615621 [Nephila pilipes]
MKEKPWINAILNLLDCPRSIAVAAFRLTTGQDCFYAPLCRFRIVYSRACPLFCNDAALNDTSVCSALTKNCIYSCYWRPETL